jgi:hypothetical protein
LKFKVLLNSPSPSPKPNLDHGYVSTRCTPSPILNPAVLLRRVGESYRTLQIERLGRSTHTIRPHR